MNLPFLELLKLVIDPELVWERTYDGVTWAGIVAASGSCSYVTGTGLGSAVVAKLSDDGSPLWYSYLGGSHNQDYGLSVAIDGTGDVLISGHTHSSDFGGAINTFRGVDDAFVAKLSGNGVLAWARYIGGSFHDAAWDIAVSNDGDVLVAGHTSSSDLEGITDPPVNLNTPFAAKLGRNGSLIWATYVASVGESGKAIAGDADGNVIVGGGGRVENMCCEGSRVSKLDDNGALIWSTTITVPQSTFHYDFVYDIAVDTLGNVLVSGHHDDGLFSEIPYHFVAKMDGDGSILWTTYLGGSGFGFDGNIGTGGIALDAEGNVLVSGATWRVSLLSPGSDQRTTHNDLYVVVLADDGTPLSETFLVKEGSDRGNDLTLDEAGNILVAGYDSNSDGIVAKFARHGLRGSSFHDLNGDGVRDSNEPGLPGLTIYVDENDNGTFDEDEPYRITNDSGEYAFLDLSPGTYRLEEIQQTGWGQSAPSSGTHVATLSFDEIIEDLNFGNFRLSEIRGAAWEDVDRDGIWDERVFVGDPPDLVLVLDVSGSTSDHFGGTPVGDVNGDGTSDTILDAELAGLIALNQKLIDLQFGQTGDVAIITFNSSATQLDMNPVAAGVQLATHPRADTDDDGILDVEQVLRAIQVGGSTAFEPALQAAENTFSTLATPPGHGNVVFLSDGFPGDSGSFTDEVSRLEAMGINLRAYGMGTGASLDALLVIDPNARIITSTDELLDVFLAEDEPGLPGVTVYQDINGNGLLEADVEPSMTTIDDAPGTEDVDETGWYWFEGLSPGQHRVCQVVLDSYEQTFPADGAAHVVTLTSGDARTGINLGSTLLLGDLNHDAEVNGLDVDPFVDLLLSSRFDVAADMNGDGAVNGLDVELFVATVLGSPAISAVAMEESAFTGSSVGKTEDLEVTPLVPRQEQLTSRMYRTWCDSHLPSGRSPVVGRDQTTARVSPRLPTTKLRLHRDGSQFAARRMTDRSDWSHGIADRWHTTVELAIREDVDWIG